MLEECDPRSVYCNVLDDFAPLAEGSAAAGGPHTWRPRVRRPFSVSAVFAGSFS